MGDRGSFGVAMDEFCTALRRRQIKGSMPTARRTAELLRVLVATGKHPDGASLIADIKKYGAQMQAAKPLELAISNMVRRVLSLIRDEHIQEAAEEGMLNLGAPAQPMPSSQAEVEGGLSKAFRETTFGQVGLHNLLNVGPVSPFLQEQVQTALFGGASAERAGRTSSPAESTPPQSKGRSKSQRPQWNRKPAVIETVNELIDELDLIESQILMQSLEHIHANEVILTRNYSTTTYRFLKEAAKKRYFQVVVAEGAPEYDGHRTAKLLSQSSIPTTAISDAAVFAMMARVNKVIVGAHAVLANGGVMAPVGTHMLALAAKRHAVPFVVLVGLHKLSPMFPHAPDVAFNDFRSPADVIGFDVVASGSTVAADNKGHGVADSSVHVINPQYDYIPPELVTIFVTDTGGYTPSYVYRLLSEYYKREDYALVHQDPTKVQGTPNVVMATP